MSRHPDLGQVLSLANGVLDSTYRASVVGDIQSRGVTVQAEATFKAGTAVTNMYVKLQWKAAGASGWSDIVTKNLSTATEEIEHVIAPADGATVPMSFQTLNARFTSGSLRVVAKAAGVVAAGDSIAAWACAA